MENIITSTTYVPLQPPFQIIKWSGNIAMQIGTLIVTIQKEGNDNDIGYSIETHSHPVVAYENKENERLCDRQLSGHQFLEGAVWNYVEVKNVTTVCLHTARLSWEEFMDFLARDVERRFCGAQPSPGYYWQLQRLCRGVERPENKEYTVHLETRQPMRQGVPEVRSRAGDVLVLNARAGDAEEMWEIMSNRLQNYAWVIRDGQRPNKDFHIVYDTDEDCYRSLVDRLNAEREYTYMLYPFAD